MDAASRTLPFRLGRSSLQDACTSGKAAWTEGSLPILPLNAEYE